MAAPQQHAAAIGGLEVEIDTLLQEQVESLGRPLLSITTEEAKRFAVGRDKLTALVKELSCLRASSSAHQPNSSTPQISDDSAVDVISPFHQTTLPK